MLTFYQFILYIAYNHKTENANLNIQVKNVVMHTYKQKMNWKNAKCVFMFLLLSINITKCVDIIVLMLLS